MFTPDAVSVRRDTGPGAGALALAPWIVCVPSLLLVAYVAAAATIGWNTGEFNLAEAAIYGDAGEVVRLIANGASPRASYVARAAVTRRDTDLVLTPMEAAIEEGHTLVAKLLLARGAVTGAAQAEQLRCLAAGKQRADIAALLAAAYSDDDGPCRTPERP